MFGNWHLVFGISASYTGGVPLPPELQDRLKRQSGDVQLSLKTTQGDKAIIEGKTSIPFGSFVKLILKRKVQTLRDFQDEPIILSSNLLTHLASAPEDSHEDTSKVILTALLIGFCFGMFLTAFTLIFSSLFGIEIGVSELLTGLLVLLAVALAVYASLKISSHKMKQQLIEKVEEIAGLFAKK